jgi:competence protein ComEC
MIAYYKSEVPFIRLVLCFIIGIVSAIYFNIAPSNYYLLFWIIICSLFIAIIIFLKKRIIYLHSYLFGFFIYLIMILSGIIICNQHKEIFKEHHFSKTPSKQLIVYLLEEPKIKGDIARFNVEVTNNIQEKNIFKTQGKLLLAMRFDTTKNINLHYGDIILIKSKYKETEPAYNPSEFDYKRFLSYQQIYYQSFINQKEIKKLAEHAANPIKEFALKFRERQIEKFDNYLQDSSVRAVASTLILGYRAELSKDILQTYTKTGTMHVLSVSGMHVGIVVYLLAFMLIFLNKSKRGRILQAIIIISLVWFYALITGLAPSIERAAIMTTFIMLAKARSLKANTFNIIAITAFIILIFDPFAIINVGFQLSFIAVSGIIYLQPLIYNFYITSNKILDWIWKIMSVSIAAQIATAPISLYYFHQFPVYFIFSNIFIFIPAILIMYFGLFFLLLYFVPPIAKFLAWCLEFTINLTNDGLKLIEHIPHANITQIWWGSLEILLFYAFFLLAFASIQNKKLRSYSYFTLLILISSISLKAFQHIKQKQALFFSLRKNTAVALIKGNNAVLITDLKPDEFTFLFSVKPYLDSCQVDYIQWINPHLTQNEKMFSFEGKKLKIINHQSENFVDSKQDWLLLSSNKKQDLQSIKNTNSFQMLFIDGKNRDFIIEDFKNQAQKLNLKPNILKRNFAVEIKL